MIINELSKELGVKNKEVIDYLKSNGFKVSSHMQNATDEMIEKARDYFSQPKAATKKAEPEKVAVKPAAKTKNVMPERTIKKFAPDDLIPCRSIVPWYVETIGVDRMTTYKWPYFGDVEYVAYRDLQSWRRKSVVKDGMIFIEDPDICEQWKNDLANMYSTYAGVSFPEEFFEKSDEEFENMLRNASDTFKDVIKYTAMSMIRNENYPTIQKITIIDNVLGTGIKEFL